MLTTHAVPFLIFMLSGWVALIHNCLVAGLLWAMACGLWCLSELMRKIAIGFICYSVLNGLLILILYPSPVQTVVSLAQTAQNGIALWFLITRKAAFGKPTIARQA